MSDWADGLASAMNSNTNSDSDWWKKLGQGLLTAGTGWYTANQGSKPKQHQYQQQATTPLR